MAMAVNNIGLTIQVMKPFLPYYSTPPCKVLEYRLERFDDNHGHTDTLRIVRSLDKNKKEAVSQVIWD